MNVIKKLFVLILCAGLLLSSAESSAHHQRYQSGGRHHRSSHDNEHDTKHYYCGGHPAHLHQNNVCPYASDSGTYNQKATGNSNLSDGSNISKVKKIQKKLNKLGYKCGKADGICDKKTRRAIKRYQDANNLKTSGKINKSLCRKLNIN